MVSHELHEHDYVVEAACALLDHSTANRLALIDFVLLASHHCAYSWCFCISDDLFGLCLLLMIFPTGLHRCPYSPHHESERADVKSVSLTDESLSVCAVCGRE